MGEIKSAIELAMERTSNMSLSKEERARQKQEDFEKMMNGAIQHYADGFFSIDDFRDRIIKLNLEYNTKDNKMLISSVLKRIDPERDNKRWLDLLSILEPAFCDSLQRILSDYHTEQSKLIKAAKGQVLQQLAQKGIFGSAIEPNPGKDSLYQSKISDLRNQTQTRIGSILK